MTHAGTGIIETERLVLRPFKIEDAEDMYTAWASDSEVTKILTWPAHTDVVITESILSSWIAEYSKAEYYNWAITLKETGRAVGNISVVCVKEDISALSIGYCLSRSLWSKGIMSESLAAVICYLFENTSVNRIDATHDIENPASGRVMAKCGMKKEGDLRSWARNNRGLEDVVMYSILRSEWENS